MKIGGLQKFSLLDYPEHISAIIFTQGCNFRCQFCYNPMLVETRGVTGKLQITSSPELGEEIKKGNPLISEEALFDFLNSRINKIDAVVITGGEPTMHYDLARFIAKIKNLGFKIKLDTNGTNPKMLKELIESSLLDYLAMDIKAAPKKYDLVTGIQPNLRAIKESIKLIKESNVSYEFRSTIVPGLIETEDVEEMGKMIAGAKAWYLQQFKSDIDLVNKNFQGISAYDDNVLERMRQIALAYVGICEIR